MKKIVAILVSLVLVAGFLFCGILVINFLLDVTGISRVEEVGYFEKVKTAETQTFEVPAECGQPEKAVVQLACDLGHGRHEFKEIRLIKTSEGLYAPETGELFNTELFGVGFKDGQLLPAVVVCNIKDDPHMGILGWKFDGELYYYSHAVRFITGCSYRLCAPCKEEGVMDNYVASVDGQVVRFEKTYDYAYKAKKVRKWYWKEWKRSVRRDVDDVKEYIADAFIF